MNINPQCATRTAAPLDLQRPRRAAGEHAEHLAGSISYVTGSHNLKFGVQREFGPDVRKGTMNADLVENYSNGKPSTVTVNNTPYNAPGHIDYDMGVYLQDSWTIKRLTFSPGIRVEYFQVKRERNQHAGGSLRAGALLPEEDADSLGT